MAQRLPLLRSDEVVELTAWSGCAVALGEPQEDALVGAVQLVPDQGRAGRVEVRADLVLASRARLAAQERQRPAAFVAVAREQAEDRHRRHAVRVRPCFDPDARGAHRERHVHLEFVGARLSLADRQVGLLHLPRSKRRLERAGVQGAATAGDEPAGLPIETMGGVGLFPGSVAVAGLQRPRQRRDVVARGRMQRQARRLVDHQEPVVLVHHRHRRRLPLVAGRTLAQGEAQPRPHARLGQELRLRVH